MKDHSWDEQRKEMIDPKLDQENQKKMQRCCMEPWKRKKHSQIKRLGINIEIKQNIEVKMNLLVKLCVTV